MPDAVEILTRDHRKVEGLFERYQKGDSEVIPQVCTELKVHTSIEEEVLYPALDDVDGGAALRREAEHEHQEVKEAIEQLERTGYNSPDGAKLMSTIIDGVSHHVLEEEEQVLPKMKSELGAERMSALGEQLLAAKRQQLMQEHALVDLTKDELYELAQGAAIEGRSEMTKEQLIEALQH